MTRTKKKSITPKVILIKCDEDINKVIGMLKNGDEVIVNVSLLEKIDSYKVIYFLSGFTFAYEGKRNKIEDKIYLFKLL